MNFMPDTHVTCEDCQGRRYGEELSTLRWNGKSIADVLAMSFEEAANFFSFHTRLAALMQLMVETGLGYITLGQYSPTLSGGEAQRLKLVSELAKGLPSLKERQYNLGAGNLYLLEEPSIGLHSSDVERLNHLLHRLVDQGHTVVLIEHHLDRIAEADYIVEIGPKAEKPAANSSIKAPLPTQQNQKQPNCRFPAPDDETSNPFDLIFNDSADPLRSLLLCVSPDPSKFLRSRSDSIRVHPWRRKHLSFRHDSALHNPGSINQHCHCSCPVQIF